MHLNASVLNGSSTILLRMAGAWTSLLPWLYQREKSFKSNFKLILSNFPDIRSGFFTPSVCVRTGMNYSAIKIVAKIPFYLSYLIINYSISGYVCFSFQSDKRKVIKKRKNQ